MAEFSDEIVEKVWAKAATDGAENTQKGFRKDACGAWIYRRSYGMRSDYGWEIDHITPVSKGGTDALSNLRPLHWRNNVEKSDGRLACAVRAVGGENRSVA